MATEVKAIDVSNVPELLKLAEEVRTSGEPRLLRRDGEDLAILRPARKRGSKRTKKLSDHEAFLSSAGGWKGLLDPDKFLADIYERRRHTTRTPVEL
jgi:hypothetical protein